MSFFAAAVASLVGASAAQALVFIFDETEFDGARRAAHAVQELLHLALPSSSSYSSPSSPFFFWSSVIFLFYFFLNIFLASFSYAVSLVRLVPIVVGRATTAMARMLSRSRPKRRRRWMRRSNTRTSTRSGTKG